MNTDHKETWPVCYRTQREAGVPEGNFAEERDSPRTMFCAGVLIGLLLIGPALCDLYQFIRGN